MYYKKKKQKDRVLFYVFVQNAQRAAPVPPLVVFHRPCRSNRISALLSVLSSALLCLSLELICLRDSHSTKAD